MKFFPRNLATLLMGALLSAPALLSATTFVENFGDNTNGWSNVDSPGGRATIGTDPGASGQSVWYATDAGAGAKTSVLTLGTPVSILGGSLTLDFSVRVDKTADATAYNRFQVQLSDKGADDRRIIFDIRPGPQASRFTYRNDANNGWGTKTGSAYTYLNTTEFVDFRLIMSDNGDNTLNAEGFKRDSGDSDWVSFVVPLSLPTRPVLSTRSTSSPAMIFSAPTIGRISISFRSLLFPNPAPSHSSLVHLRCVL
jgi:hypothetical protein